MHFEPTREVRSLRCEPKMHDAIDALRAELVARLDQSVTALRWRPELVARLDQSVTALAAHRGTKAGRTRTVVF